MKLLLAGALFLLMVGTSISVSASTIPAAPHHSSNQGTTITVLTYLDNGTQIKGMFIELENQRGQDLQTGYSPITFHVVSGQTYLIYADSYRSIRFATWSYPPTSQDPLHIANSDGPLTLIAQYHSPTITTSTSTSHSTSTSFTIVQ